MLPGVYIAFGGGTLEVLRIQPGCQGSILAYTACTPSTSGFCTTDTACTPKYFRLRYCEYCRYPQQFGRILPAVAVFGLLYCGLRIMAVNITAGHCSAVNTVIPRVLAALNTLINSAPTVEYSY